MTDDWISEGKTRWHPVHTANEGSRSPRRLWRHDVTSVYDRLAPVRRKLSLTARRRRCWASKPRSGTSSSVVSTHPPSRRRGDVHFVSRGFFVAGQQVGAKTATSCTLRCGADIRELEGKGGLLFLSRRIVMRVDGGQIMRPPTWYLAAALGSAAWSFLVFWLGRDVNCVIDGCGLYALVLIVGLSVILLVSTIARKDGQTGVAMAGRAGYLVHGTGLASDDGVRLPDGIPTRLRPLLAESSSCSSGFPPSLRCASSSRSQFESFGRGRPQRSQRRILKDR
jgi:hypothetical protein